MDFRLYLLDIQELVYVHLPYMLQEVQSLFSIFVFLDSSFEYTDSTGTDLHEFIVKTLRNPR